MSIEDFVVRIHIGKDNPKSEAKSSKFFVPNEARANLIDQGNSFKRKVPKVPKGKHHAMFWKFINNCHHYGKPNYMAKGYQK